MRIIAHIMCSLLLWQQVTGFLQWKEYEAKKLLVADCLAEVISFMHTQYNETYALAYAAKHLQQQQHFSDVIDAYFQQVKEVPYYTGLDGFETLNTAIKIYVVLVDSLESLLALAKTYRSRPKENFIPVVVLMPDEKFYTQQKYFLEAVRKDMLGIFQHYFHMYILHAFILLPLNHQELQIFTYDPYKSTTNCRDLTPRLLVTYKAPFQTGWSQQIFNKHINLNFNGCPVVVVTDDMPPYITLSAHEPYVNGIDGEILQLLAQKLNFSIQIVFERISSAHVYTNATATGVFKWVIEKRANMSIGDLSCTPQRLRHLAFTRPYYQTEMFGLLTAKQYTSMEVLFLPLSRPVLLFGIILFVAHLSLKRILLRFFRNNAFLQHVLQQKLLFTFIYVSIFYRLLYESTYFSYVQTPPRKSLPSTTHQLHLQGYKIISDYVSRNYMERLKGDELESIVISTDWSQNESTYFLRQNKPSDICLITKMPYLNYYINNAESMREIHSSKKYVIYMDQNCYFFPKYSFLAESVDNTLQRLHNFGIIKYIFSKQTSLGGEGGKKLVYPVTKLWKPINLNLISGPLKLYFIILCFILLFFLLEIYFYRYITCRQIYELLM